MGIRRSDPVLRATRGVAAVAACLVLANCASSGKFAGGVDPKYGVSSSPRVVAFGDPVPKGGGTYRVGRPYTVAGQVYVPEEDPHYRAEGLASWYGDDFHGRLTANGEVFDMASLTAAHPTLPMPCYARVTNLSNGKSLIVRVNDRGPYHGNRVMDVSSRAADLLEFKGNGVARVRVEYVGRAPLEGSDDRQLIATLRTGMPAPSPSLVRVASVRPFVPEAPSSGRAIRGEVPMPEGRPYSLGNTSADQASISATSEMSASARMRSSGRILENPRAVSYEDDGRYASGARPVSAYAPVDPRGPSELLAGRGLY
jgi:peptidoglycan lytic transglycosylase